MAKDKHIKDKAHYRRIGGGLAFGTGLKSAGQAWFALAVFFGTIISLNLGPVGMVICGLSTLAVFIGLVVVYGRPIWDQSSNLDDVRNTVHAEHGKGYFKRALISLFNPTSIVSAFKTAVKETIVVYKEQRIERERAAYEKRINKQADSLGLDEEQRTTYLEERMHEHNEQEAKLDLIDKLKAFGFKGKQINTILTVFEVKHAHGQVERLKHHMRHKEFDGGSSLEDIKSKFEDHKPKSIAEVLDENKLTLDFKKFEFKNLNDLHTKLSTEKDRMERIVLEEKIKTEKSKLDAFVKEIAKQNTQINALANSLAKQAAEEEAKTYHLNEKLTKKFIRKRLKERESRLRDLNPGFFEIFAVIEGYAVGILGAGANGAIALLGVAMLMTSIVAMIAFPELAVTLIITYVIAASIAGSLAFTMPSVVIFFKKGGRILDKGFSNFQTKDGESKKHAIAKTLTITLGVTFVAAVLAGVTLTALGLTLGGPLVVTLIPWAIAFVITTYLITAAVQATLEVNEVAQFEYVLMNTLLTCLGSFMFAFIACSLVPGPIGVIVALIGGGITFIAAAAIYAPALWSFLRKTRRLITKDPSSVKQKGLLRTVLGKIKRLITNGLSPSSVKQQGFEIIFRILSLPLCLLAPITLGLSSYVAVMVLGAGATALSPPAAAVVLTIALIAGGSTFLTILALSSPKIYTEFGLAGRKIDNIDGGFFEKCHTILGAAAYGIFPAVVLVLTYLGATALMGLIPSATTAAISGAIVAALAVPLGVIAVSPPGAAAVTGFIVSAVAIGLGGFVALVAWKLGSPLLYKGIRGVGRLSDTVLSGVGSLVGKGLLVIGIRKNKEVVIPVLTEVKRARSAESSPRGSSIIDDTSKRPMSTVSFDDEALSTVHEKSDSTLALKESFISSQSKITEAINKMDPVTTDYDFNKFNDSIVNEKRGSSSTTDKIERSSTTKDSVGSGRPRRGSASSYSSSGSSSGKKSPSMLFSSSPPKKSGGTLSSRPSVKDLLKTK